MHKTREQLEAGITHIRQSPSDKGVVELIACRPAIGTRNVLQQGELDPLVGLKGDNWQARGYAKRADHSAHPDMQLNIMNARSIGLIAGDKENWQMAGDQFFVDLDLSPANLPPGTRLAIGDAVIEVTAEPHLGCKKFAERFGKEAAIFVNTEVGKSLNLRGINARVISGGKVATGAPITKLAG